MARNFVSASSQSLTTVSAPASGAPMTIAGWAKVTNNANPKVIVAVGVSSASSRNQLQVGNGTLCTIFSIGTTQTDAVSSGVGSVDAWNHHAGVITSQTSRQAFTNGQGGTVTTTDCGAYSTANAISIGSRYNLGALGNFMSGDIAEVGIWSAALTQQEIASLADGMTCDKVRPQSLVFYAPLIRTAQDLARSLTLTNNNGATVANHPRVYA